MYITGNRGPENEPSASDLSADSGKGAPEDGAPTDHTRALSTPSLCHPCMQLDSQTKRKPNSGVGGRGEVNVLLFYNLLKSASSMRLA